MRLQVDSHQRTQDRTLWHGTAWHGMAYAPTSARTEHAHKIAEGGVDRGSESTRMNFRMCMRCMCTRESVARDLVRRACPSPSPPSPSQTAATV